MTLVAIGHQEHHSTVLCHEAHECPVCHTMRHIFINRGGETTCLYCEPKDMPDA